MRDYKTAKHMPIRGYESDYDVYDNGQILSKLTDMWLRQSVDTKGYLKVVLNKDGEYKTYRVHVLVAQHFIPNPMNLPVVNHIDGNKTNPDYTNLEWVTYSENTKHAHDTHLITKTNNKVVVRGDGVEYKSLTEAATANGITKSAISKVLHGVRKSAGGHTWTEKSV